MKRIALLCCLLPFFCMSQEKQTSVHVISSVGIAGGENAIKPLFQLGGLLSFKKYAVGIGAGYDRYQFNSFPVFADARYYLGKKNMAFLYLDGGYHFPGSYHKEDEYAKMTDKMTGGFYMDAGVGFRLPAGKYHHFIICTGYTRKDMIRKKGFVYPCGIVGPCQADETIYAYHYHFNRIVTKLSWEIGRE